LLQGLLPARGTIASATGAVVERTQALLVASHRPATLRAYLATWGRFQRFCEGQGWAEAERADGWQIAAFLAQVRDAAPDGRVRLAHTIANAASAIRTILRLRGRHLAAEDDALVSRATRGARVLDARDVRTFRLPAGNLIGQSAPVRRASLRAMTAVVDLRTRRVDVVCFAAACLAHHCFLRVGEYCDGALRWEDVSEDLSRVSIRRAKGAFRGDTVAVPRDVSLMLCPRRWLLRLRRSDEVGAVGGAVFRIGDRPLTATAMSSWLQAAAAAAAVAPGCRVTPHGLRSGGAIDAILAGTPIEVVRVHGRWASVASMAPYMRFATSAIAATMRFEAPDASPLG
jgi:integrase